MRFNTSSVLFGVILLASCDSKQEPHSRFEVTKMNCALFASRYDLFGGSNAAANIKFEIVRHTKFKSAIGYYQNSIDEGFFAGWRRFFFETSMENWIEARVNSRNEKSLNEFSQACVAMLQKLGSK